MSDYYDYLYAYIRNTCRWAWTSLDILEYLPISVEIEPSS